MTRTIRFSLKANKKMQKNVNKLVDFAEKYGINIHTKEYLRLTTIEIKDEHYKIASVVQNYDNSHYLEIFLVGDYANKIMIKLNDIRTIIEL